jgi:two-component system CheB/CheR fusion protein
MECVLDSLNAGSWNNDEQVRFRSEDLDDSSQIPSFVVGIGASAGGLEALEHLFQEMPTDSGMAFVVVQHLSPDFKSMMNELLARWTNMPIHLVRDGMPVQPNQIFLMPAKTEVIISNGRLLLTEREPGEELRLPIDQFFRSLARDVGEKAVAIVLSGTGSDGSRGLRDVHAAGGFVIAQSDETAKFDGMPKSAVETGVVDLILSPGEIPRHLIRLAKHSPLDPIDENGVDSMDLIFRLLRDAYGIDFSYYKPSTVTRRIERRIHLTRMDDLEGYVIELRSNKAELDALYHDLLIGVTSFFRDPEAFGFLGTELLPNLIDEMEEGSDYRVWVAGCATGEEAYSLAILLHEQILKSGKHLNLKIFATDVHSRSLEIAASGYYRREMLTSVSEERIRRYFIPTDDGYRVSPELRNLVVFASHNIIRDAPFTRLELISCRNLLIYLLPAAQKKALSLFHFGLKTGGILFLGPSETAGDLGDEFQPMENHWKVFRKRRDAKLPSDLRLPLSSGRRGSVTNLGVGYDRNSVANPMGEIFERVLGQSLPPSVLVNERLEVVHTFGEAAHFLRLQSGSPSLLLLDMLPDDLRMSVGAAIHRATRDKQMVTFRGVQTRINQEPRMLNVSVMPIQATRRAPFHLLVQFQPSESAPLLPANLSNANLAEATREHVEALEAELRFAKENLQATIEELETSNEELQATNEELLASNEELQSTNEELHSVNEELYTVNAEYQKKIEEQTELTQDMNNLLESTEVHTMFLDENLCIRKFTPRMADVFNLIPSDVGRKVHSFAHTINSEGLVGKLEGVLQDKAMLEEEVQTAAGDCFLMRILPYQGDATRSGVVFTLVDITVLKVAETRFRNALEVAPNGMLVVSEKGFITLVNSEAQRIFGYPEAELIGKPIEFLLTSDQSDGHSLLLSDYFRNPVSLRRVGPNAYVWGTAKDGRKIPLDFRVEPVQTPYGTQSIAAVVDISEHQKLESSLRTQVSQRDRFLATLSHELRNPMAAILTASSVLERIAVDHSSTINSAAGVIRRQATQIATLLDDLLDVARVTQGKIKLRRETADLRVLCEEAIEAIQPLLREHQTALALRTTETEVWSNVDRVRFIQVMENLLTNAIKYTQPKGTIEVLVQTEESHAVVRVKDNGCGIAPNFLETIFDMFVQSDDTLDRSEGGMGVGLTLVRSLVELHGGTITAKSSGLGLGSEFVVRLSPMKSNQVRTPDVKHPSQVSNLRMVLVEDNQDAREMMAILLAHEGYQIVATAASGTEGLETILRLRPDVAMLDIGLPGMDGYELARKLRGELQQTIHLIALTGYGGDENHEACLAAGFDRHLVKPIGINALRDALRSIHSEE